MLLILDFSFEKADDGAGLTCSSKNLTCFVQNHGLYSSLMSHKCAAAAWLVIMCNSYITLLVRRCDKYGISSIRVQRTKTFGIVASVNCVNESEISEVVDIDTSFKNNNNSRFKMIRDLTYLSLRSLTAITLFLNESSPIAFC